MRLGIAGVVLLAGCGGFLGFGGDDDDGTPATAGSDASIDALTAEGASTIDATAAETCPGGAGCERVVFTTRVTVAGEFGGVDNADAHCRTAAEVSTNAAVKGRTFRAYLSAGGVSPAGRLVHGTKAYRRPDGKVIANDWDGFVALVHLAPMDLDENGVGLPNDNAWVGTNELGAPTNDDCAGWTTTEPNATGTGGTIGTEFTWNEPSAAKACIGLGHIYCVEQ